MIARNFILFCLAIGSLTGAVSPESSAASKGGITPGNYRDWNGDIDEVTIVQPFRADSYNDIAVESFDITGVPMPNPRDNTYHAVQSAIGLLKPAFLEGFRANLREKAGSGVPAPRGKRSALVIRARVIKLDPGSQAARYWGGFGMGAVKVEMTGEIIDAASRKTLVRFRQERRSGFGAFGGGYGALFARTAHQIGGDIAGLVSAF
jgi:hypothetical protein